jgi:hypothetical protein
VGYARRVDCIHALNRVREEGADAPMLYDNFAPIGQPAGAMVTPGNA